MTGSQVQLKIYAEEESLAMGKIVRNCRIINHLNYCENILKCQQCVHDLKKQHDDLIMENNLLNRYINENHAIVFKKLTSFEQKILKKALESSREEYETLVKKWEKEKQEKWNKKIDWLCNLVFGSKKH